MMGMKARLFTPVSSASLEELAPVDHFYRHLDRVLDLSLVRDLVQGHYVAGIGRPSVDPIVFFKLQLVMFFEGIRSERQLVRLAADRLSVRWYPRLYPPQGLARPLQPQPYPRPLRPGGLSPLL